MRTILAGVALFAAVGSLATPASAQTAYEINRLNQAVQICNSPMGAGMAECAQLRARLAGGGGAPGVGGLGGYGGGTAGKAAGIANLLGAALTAARSQQPSVAPGPNGAEVARPAGAAAPAPNPFGNLLPQR